LEPQASAIHYPLAMAYRALGDRQKAVAHLAKRGEGWPSLPDPLMEQQRGLLETVTAYEQRGVDALAAGDVSAAVAAFRKGLDLDPDDAAMRNRLGKALYASGDAAGAIKELNEVVRRSPDFAPGHASLGTLHTLRGSYNEAVVSFTTAIEADPDSVDARLGLAEALRASGQPQASLPHYDRAVDLNPAISEAWVGKALALVALRRYPEARAWLARARRLHPTQQKLAEIEKLLPP
jgi:tetratricopeptide (TPR) repeat protein